MRRIIPLLFTALIILPITACHKKSHPVWSGIPKIIAISDDTTLKYQLVIFPNAKFIYSIIRINQQQQERKDYAGSYSYQSDTFYLNFRREKPDDLTPYLTKEMSGHYLIQHFTDDRRAAFLWIRPLIYR